MVDIRDARPALEPEAIAIAEAAAADDVLTETVRTDERLQWEARPTA